MSPADWLPLLAVLPMIFVAGFILFFGRMMRNIERTTELHYRAFIATHVREGKFNLCADLECEDCAGLRPNEARAF